MLHAGRAQSLGEAGYRWRGQRPVCRVPERPVRDTGPQRIYMDAQLRLWCRPQGPGEISGHQVDMGKALPTVALSQAKLATDIT